MDNNVKAAPAPETLGCRVLQVGYGAFGRVHARAWLRLLAPAQLIIADPSPAARQEAARAYPEAEFVSDWRSALARADILDIVCPAELHAPVAVAALAAGKDVFIEKPATATLAEAEAIWQAAQASGRLLAVGYVLRQHPVVRAAQRALGKCGRLHTVEADFVALKRPRTDAGVLLNDAIHFLDLLVWLLGGQPIEISATLGDHLGRGTDDRAMLVMRWPGDVLVRLTASCLVAGTHSDPYVTSAGAEKRLAISGDFGRLDADLLAGLLTFRSCRLERTGATWTAVDAAAETVRFAQPSAEDMVTAELANFCAAVARRDVPENGNHDAVVGMAALIDTIIAASRQRRTIVLGVGRT
jgi:predicted dehydrogenase